MEVFPLFAAAMVSFAHQPRAQLVRSPVLGLNPQRVRKFDQDSRHRLMTNVVPSQLAGNISRLPASDLNNAALSFFTARTLYMALYLGIKGENGLAYARTGAYAWSVSIPIWGLWKAGEAMNRAGREL